MLPRLASPPKARPLAHRFWNVWAGPLIILILAPAAIPFFADGFPWGHDTPPHLQNLFRFDRALWQGQFPVRWVEGVHPGAGQPLFNFYQVGFYYFVEALHATGVRLSTAFEAAPVILWWIGALFTWRWLRPFGPAPAFAGSVTFALSPYVIIDVFVRAAYPEFMAIVCSVGTLWAADAFLRTGRAAYLPALSGLSALLLISHLPACMIAAPLLAGQVVVRAVTDPASRQRLPALVASGALGVGLAAFYVLPALWELDLVSMHRLTTAGVDYRNNFVPAEMWAPRVRFEWNYFGTMVSGADNLMPLQISVVQWAIVVSGIAWLIMRPSRPSRFAMACAGLWILTIAYALFMMHEASRPIWDRVSALAVVQFPWRFFLLVSIAAAGLTAALLSQVPHRLRAVSVALIVAAQMVLYYPHLRPGTFIERQHMNIDDPAAMARTDRARRTFEEPGYDPAGTEPDLTASTTWTLLGAGTTRVVSQADADVALQIDAPQEVRLRFNIPAFPGWTITIDGAPAAVERAPNGYMLVTVPAGAHLVRARFANTSVRLAANSISVVSAVAIALTAWFAGRRHGVTDRRTSAAPASAST